MIRLLVERYNADLLDSDSYTKSLFETAVLTGNVATVRLLLSLTDPSLVDPHAGCVAAASGNVKMVSAFIEAGCVALVNYRCENVRSPEHTGLTAFFIACKDDKNIEIVRLFLNVGWAAPDTGPLNPETGAPMGLSPLTFAAIHNASAVAKLLIENGAPVDATPDHWRIYTHFKMDSILNGSVIMHGDSCRKDFMVAGTPFATAALHGSIETMAVLIDAGADPNRVIFSLPCIDGSQSDDGLQVKKLAKLGLQLFGVLEEKCTDEQLNAALTPMDENQLMEVFDAALTSIQSAAPGSPTRREYESLAWSFNAVSAAAAGWRIESLFAISQIDSVKSLATQNPDRFLSVSPICLVAHTKVGRHTWPFLKEVFEGKHWRAKSREHWLMACAESSAASAATERHKYSGGGIINELILLGYSVNHRCVLIKNTKMHSLLIAASQTNCHAVQFLANTKVPGSLSKKWSKWGADGVEAIDLEVAILPGITALSLNRLKWENYIHTLKRALGEEFRQDAKVIQDGVADFKLVNMLLRDAGAIAWLEMPSLKVNLGQTFDLIESMGALQSHAGANKIIDVNGVKIRSANGQDYGDGVTRQWINQVGRALLMSSDLFVQSDAGAELATTSLKAAGNDGAEIASDGNGERDGNTNSNGNENADPDSNGDGVGTISISTTVDNVVVDGSEDTTAPLRKASLKAVAKARFQSAVESVMANSAGTVAAAARNNVAVIPATIDEESEAKGGADEDDGAGASVDGAGTGAGDGTTGDQGCLERTMAISPLSVMGNKVDSDRMIAVGRFLALALLRNEPVGVSLAPSTLKLLLGQNGLVEWRDLAQVLPELQFGALAACLEPGLSTDAQTALFGSFRTNSLGLIPGDDEVASFQIPSREARRYEALQVSRSESEGSADDALTQSTPLSKEEGEEKDEGVGDQRAAPAAEPSAAAAAPPAASLQPMRMESELDVHGAEHEITSQNVQEFADAWAYKELILNTEDQIKAVLEGFADVNKGTEFLSKLRSEHGKNAWKELQRLIRGSTQIDVAGWKDAVNIVTSGNVDDAVGQKTINLFWAQVQTLSQASKQKLLYYWSSMLPPAGGMQSIKEGERFQLVLRSKEQALHLSKAMMPESHTCFRQMIIPVVDTAEEMETIIALAVSHWAEFGYDFFE